MCRADGGTCSLCCKLAAEFVVGLPPTRARDISVNVFMVEAYRGDRRWISGFFRTRLAAQQYLDKVPASPSTVQTIRDVGPLTYPFFVAELEWKFEALNGQGVQDLAREISVRRSEFPGHFNLYRIVNDWSPARPGADYMGELPHVHVEEAELAKVVQRGPESLF